jgi:hypothetical protein
VTLVHEEALADRADELEGHGLNGIDRVLVQLEPAGAPVRAVLDVLFHNALHLDALRADPGDLRTRFPISGGRRHRGGSAPGDVQVVAIAAGVEAHSLRLTVEPIGDYATYRLRVPDTRLDPVFAEVPFRFRPGCFTTECAPRPARRARPIEPVIDYTAKDYASFKHLLVTAMGERIPGWTPASEADLTQLLLDTLAAAADELSDYQDRVVHERALATARNRVSLARHARLVDYHVHQGNQATTWLVVEVGAGADVTFDRAETLVATTPSGEPFELSFEEPRPRRAIGALDAALLYTWEGTRPGLDVGDTSADLALSAADATVVADAIAAGDVAQLVIWEALDPATGRDAGRDRAKRQLLRLVPPAIAGVDPVTGASYVRVTWRAEDALRAPYCASVSPDDVSTISGVSRVSGNLFAVRHGRRRTIAFAPPESARPGEPAWDRTRWGTLCRLPDDAALLYRDTPPGGDVAPASTAAVETEVGGVTQAWTETISLVHARAGDHAYAVETDELGRSVLRFDSGERGDAVPDHAVVNVSWQSGQPLAGNVGVDAITRCADARVVACWNPFDVTTARAPEPREQITRRAPEHYRAVQLRWVSLADVVARAEEVPGVARAAARYTWTGSWTAIRLAIDPIGRDTLTPELRGLVAAQLAPLALVGDDLEIRGPRYVPVEIAVRVCIAAHAWPEHVRAALEDELSDGHTADGRRGLFHPDEWTFGQALHASQVIGRVQAVPGVEHVVSVELRRYRAPTPGAPDRIAVDTDEIIMVRNDPSEMERGVVELHLIGGRG